MTPTSLQREGCAAAATMSRSVFLSIQCMNRAAVKQFLMSGGKYENMLKLAKWNLPVNNIPSNIHEAVATVVSNTKSNINTRTNNAMILLDPYGHPVPANKYKGFLRRHGKSMSRSIKQTLLTRTAQPNDTYNSYRQRYPNRMVRAMTGTHLSNPPKILARAFFPGGPVPIKYVGGGANGKVYATNDNRMIKFVLGSAPQEYETLKKLQSTRIVPTFRNGNGKVIKLTFPLKEAANKMFGRVNSTMTGFIMGGVGGSNPMTLKNYVDKYPDANRANIERRVRHIIDTMYGKGISHGDLHQANIIVEVSPSGKISRMWAIDFGRSREIPLNKTARIMLSNSQTILKSMGIKPNTFASRLLGKPLTINVPLGGTVMNHRIDPHMFEVLTGKKYTRENENRIRNRRKSVSRNLSLLKSPRRSPARRATSASPARRKLN